MCAKIRATLYTAGFVVNITFFFLEGTLFVRLEVAEIVQLKERKIGSESSLNHAYFYLQHRCKCVCISI